MLNYPAWTNGKYCKIKDLNVSILDLGLIHSDATYDVIAVENGEIINLGAHLQRFKDSCANWRLPLPYSLEDLEIVFTTLIAQAPTDSLLIWVAITRGIPTSGNPRDLANSSPNVFAYVKPYFGFNKQNQATVCLANQMRNTAYDQKMKNFAWNDLNLAQWEAIDRGYDTAILLDKDGYLTEGPGFNVGIISHDGFVYAPKYNRLQGTVMDLVKRLCDRNNKPFFYTDITKPSLMMETAAMFLTSTAGNVIRVSKFEDIEFEYNETLTWLQQNI